MWLDGGCPPPPDKPHWHLRLLQAPTAQQPGWLPLQRGGRPGGVGSWIYTTASRRVPSHPLISSFFRVRRQSPSGMFRCILLRDNWCLFNTNQPTRLGLAAALDRPQLFSKRQVTKSEHSALTSNLPLITPHCSSSRAAWSSSAVMPQPEESPSAGKASSISLKAREKLSNHGKAIVKNCGDLVRQIMRDSNHEAATVVLPPLRPQTQHWPNYCTCALGHADSCHRLYSVLHQLSYLLQCWRVLLTMGSRSWSRRRTRCCPRKNPSRTRIRPLAIIISWV